MEIFATSTGYVILGPLIEELYFRGSLLPRLARFGFWAPLINVSLFSLYQFWTPWDVLTRVVILLPLARGLADQRLPRGNCGSRRAERAGVPAEHAPRPARGGERSLI